MKQMSQTNQTMRFLQQENARLQMENKELLEELHQLRDYLSAVTGLETAAEHLASEQELFPLLEKILYFALTLLDSSDGSIFLLDEEADELVFAIVRGAIESQLVNYRMPKTEGLTGWAVVNGQSVIVNDVRQDWRFSPTTDERFGFETRNMLIVPMKVGREVIGAIDVLNKHGGADFTEIDRDLLAILARTAAFALSQFA
jgi:GAF domain-containing protein